MANGPTQHLIGRREVLSRCALSLILSGLCYPKPTFGQQADSVNFRFRVPEAHAAAVKSTLVYQGREERQQEKGLPVLILIGITLLPSLADAILVLRRRLVQPGIKIDARGKEILVEVDPNLPRGAIVIVDANGGKLYEPDQLNAPADLGKVIAQAATRSK